MKSSTRIGFAGSFKCDLLLYLSKILMAAGKKVAVIDAQEEDIWSYSVPVYLDNKIVTIRDIDIFLGCNTLKAYEEIDSGKYDAVLVDFGFNKKLAGFVGQCDAAVLVSDLERCNVMRLRKFIKAYVSGIDPEKRQENRDTGNVNGSGGGIDMIKIYRDIVPGKIDTKYADSLLDLDGRLNVLMEYIMQFDETDYRCRIETQYNDSFRFKKLTKAFKGMLADILESCMEMDVKQIGKALKKAERGK